MAVVGSSLGICQACSGVFSRWRELEICGVHEVTHAFAWWTADSSPSFYPSPQSATHPAGSAMGPWNRTVSPVTPTSLSPRGAVRPAARKSSSWTWLGTVLVSDASLRSWEILGWLLRASYQAKGCWCLSIWLRLEALFSSQYLSLVQELTSLYFRKHLMNGNSNVTVFICSFPFLIFLFSN